MGQALASLSCTRNCITATPLVVFTLKVGLSVQGVDLHH